MWLTYLEACRRLKSGDLTWEEYIDQLLSRAAGGGRIEDEREGDFPELSCEDPFAYSMWRWTGSYLLKGRLELRLWVYLQDALTVVPPDASPLKAVFVAYRHGTVGDLQEKIAALRQDYGADLVKSLALLALQERRAEVLKVCFAHSDCWQSYAFEDEANRVDREKDPEVVEVLEASRFRQLYPRKEAIPKSKKQKRRDGNDPAAAFDVGGSHPVDW